MKMTTIVVHGMLNHAYQQEIIVEGGKCKSEDLQVLFNIRRHLSVQYGNNAPLVGWAIQPSPSGRWLDYIERAFDKDYKPAYIVFSVFVPSGMNMNEDLVQQVEHIINQNHHRYVMKNVILDNPDWGFLFTMADVVDSSLGEAVVEDAPTWVVPSQQAAYYPGTILEMVKCLWDEKFMNFRIVYCGKRILTNEIRFPSTEQRLPLNGLPDTSSQLRDKLEISQNTAKISRSGSPSDAQNKQAGKNTPKGMRSKPYRKRIPIITIVVVFAILCIVAYGLWGGKNPLDNVTASMHDCIERLSSEFSGRDSQRYYGDNHYQNLNQLNADYLSNGGDAQDPFYKEFKSLLDKQLELRHDDSIFMSAMHEYKETGFQAAVISTLNISDTVKLSREHSAEVQKIFSEMDAYMGAEKEMKDDSAFAKCTTVEQCNAYLTNYPDGKHRQEVMQKKVELQKQGEEALYKKCMGANATVNLCMQYLKTYPQGAHANEVKAKLAQLRPSTSGAQSTTSTSATSAEPTKQKITLTSTRHLFYALTWDNVKDNGKKFYEKFEVANSRLKSRAKNIIERANQIGRARYEEARNAAPTLWESDGRKNDILFSLEKDLRIH